MRYLAQFLLCTIQYAICLPLVILATGTFLVMTGMRWWGGVTLGHMLGESRILIPWCRNLKAVY